MKFDLPFTDKLVLAGCLAAYIAVLTIGYLDTPREQPRIDVVPCTTDQECFDLNPTIEPF